MAIVAPITAVCAVAIPVLVAFTLGERPGPFALAGIGLAVVAIVLVSQQAASEDPNRGASPKPATSGVGLALASGVGIGFFFLSLSRAGPDAGLWPVLSARLVSTTLFAALIIFRRQSIRMPPPVAWTAIACGVVDMLANLLYLVATRSGPLSIVVTLSSLYPASTVLLARLVLGERLSWRQTTGIVCAMAAVLLIVGSK
jgi:drug/metabolite transporter (DMT)-like permease